MAKVLVDESCRDTVISTLRSLSESVEKYDQEAKNLKPLVDAGFDNGEIQSIRNDIADIQQYIADLSDALGAILSAYAGMDNAFAKRLADDRETYLNS